MAVTLKVATHNPSPFMSPWTPDHTAMHRIIAIDLSAGDSSLVIDGSGSLNSKLKVTDITAAYTALSSDMGGLLRCYGTLDLTLMAASGVTGREVSVTNISDGATSVICGASDLINGLSSYDMSKNSTMDLLATDMSSWRIK